VGTADACMEQVIWFWGVREPTRKPDVRGTHDPHILMGSVECVFLPASRLFQ
jgi:hypothetical protein